MKFWSHAYPEVARKSGMMLGVSMVNVAGVDDL